ncbi:MAG: RdgB/HAM1 family non-canonical purine NTP pyrophosphatase [Deltaproteobacteria bacterium]|nr:RdgB/HAM1 family non-canonical purine NTP pyrophosphatase [Deltaproteobacteria bacterium]
MNNKRLHLATKNQHKLQEFREILKPLGYVVIGLDNIAGYNVVEDGDTFAANAIKKAQVLSDITKEPAIADDSGLVVDALDGAPGVNSARFSSVSGSQQDAANRAKLLGELTHIANDHRSARFICAIALVIPGSLVKVVEGRCEGMIAYDERGEHGFGYDPIFIPQNMQKTMAELDANEKHAISHRGRAIAKLLEILKY